MSCPVCGGDVPPKAKACPHCGSDENTGWSDKTYLDGIDLPDDDFEEKLKTEYGVNLDKYNRKKTIKWITAVLMILLFLIFYVLKC